MAYSHEVYVRQVGLKKLGFDPGALDGLDGKRTKAAMVASAGARYGSKSEAKAMSSVRPPRPLPNYWARVAVFGKPGDESKLVNLKLPYEMKLAWDETKTRKTIRMHKLVAHLFVEALTELYVSKGMAWIRKYGLDLFGGDYYDRPARGGTSKSDHAWGVAVDINPDANGLNQIYKPGRKAGNGTYEMPYELIRVFKKYGFAVGFVKGNGRRDMMHIAYINRR